MRVLALIALAALLAPFAGADSESGVAPGMNLGVLAPGLWDLYWMTTAGGGETVTLTWTPAPLFFSDHDLRVYRPGALDDGALADSELVAESSNRPFAHHSEGLALGLAPGTYVAAVVPWQTQGETYTLTTSSASLTFATTAIGFQSG